MNVLIYVNSQKDPDGIWTNNLINCLKTYDISYDYANLKSDDKVDADAIFVLGGDGTILSVVDFALKNDIALIGINVGKLGFLTEFESYETEKAVKMLFDGELVREERLLLSAEYLGKQYCALNEMFVQRAYSETSGSIITLELSIDGQKVDKIRGDGVIVSTPTGSTAYALSAGGAILAPECNVFQINPIAAHSISHRPVIFSADKTCSVNFSVGEEAGLYIDGKFIDKIKNGDKIILNKCDKKLPFLRRNDYSFFKRLTLKMNIGETEN